MPLRALHRLAQNALLKAVTLCRTRRMGRPITGEKTNGSYRSTFLGIPHTGHDKTDEWVHKGQALAGA